MKVRELMNILEKQDPEMPVVIRANSQNHIDDFTDIVPEEIEVIKAKKITCPIASKSTYDASIHAKADIEAVSLTGKSRTRF